MKTMRTSLLLYLIFFAGVASAQSEKTIKKSVYKQIKSYDHYTMRMEEWFKFQSGEDTFYRQVEAQISSLLSYPALTYSVVADRFDTTYQVATASEYTSLSKRNNTYAYFNNKKDKDILFIEYINRILYFPLEYRWKYLKKFSLSPDTSSKYYVLRLEEKIGNPQDTTIFIKHLYVSKTDYMPVMLEDWAYFEDGVQYCRQKLMYSAPMEKFNRTEFIHKLDSTSRAYRTHISSDSILQIRYQKYKVHQLGDTMKPISGRISLSKDSINLFEQGDSILIIDFSYTNCGPCIQGIPALNNLHHKYDSSGVAVYWVDPYKSDWPRIEKFSQFYKVSYPIVEVNYDYVYDYDIRGFPRLFVIKNGVLIYYHSGYSEAIEQEVIKVLELALGKK